MSDFKLVDEIAGLKSAVDRLIRDTTKIDKALTEEKAERFRSTQSRLVAD